MATSPHKEERKKKESWSSLLSGDGPTCTAGRVACCPLVSHGEYAPRARLKLEKRRDRQTDGRQTVTLRLQRENLLSQLCDVIGLIAVT